MTTYRVGSRASNLAKARVRQYLELLRPRFPGIAFSHQVILEGGDRDRRSRLSDVSAISGGSAFSSEQEAALSRGEVDVVFHSRSTVPGGSRERCPGYPGTRRRSGRPWQRS
ncbi:MAG TPA: hypothetical protein VIU15_25005 [Streptomyces sp.]